MIMASKVARDPELAARLMIEIGRALPPNSFQFVISPVKILRRFSVEMSSTVTCSLTITARPATATW